MTERQLKREFEVYGEIAEIKIVKDTQTDKPKGYAFIQFVKEEDMKAAFKDADAKKINGRRIVVDVERGRTVKSWKPKRLGGGLGRTRIAGPDKNQRHSGRDSRGNDSLQKDLGIDGTKNRERSLSPPGGDRSRRRSEEERPRSRR